LLAARAVVTSALMARRPLWPASTPFRQNLESQRAGDRRRLYELDPNGIA
jgi:hypothetical protein